MEKKYEEINIVYNRIMSDPGALASGFLEKYGNRRERHAAMEVRRQETGCFIRVLM